MGLRKKFEFWCFDCAENRHPPLPHCKVEGIYSTSHGDIIPPIHCLFDPKLPAHWEMLASDKNDI